MNGDLLCHPLSGKRTSICHTMIKNIPLSFYAYQTSMTVSYWIRSLHKTASLITNITGTMDCPLMNKISVWETAHGVVQPRHVCCRINKIIPFPNMPYGCPLKKIRFCIYPFCRKENFGLTYHRKHICS